MNHLFITGLVWRWSVWGRNVLVVPYVTLYSMNTAQPVCANVCGGQERGREGKGGRERGEKRKRERGRERERKREGGRVFTCWDLDIAEVCLCKGTSILFVYVTLYYSAPTSLSLSLPLSLPSFHFCPIFLIKCVCIQRDVVS